MFPPRVLHFSDSPACCDRWDPRALSIVLRLHSITANTTNILLSNWSTSHRYSYHAMVLREIVLVEWHIYINKLILYNMIYTKMGHNSGRRCHLGATFLQCHLIDLRLKAKPVWAMTVRHKKKCNRYNS